MTAAPKPGAAILSPLFDDGRALQAAIGAGRVTRADHLSALRSDIIQLDPHFRVFSDLRLDAAWQEAAIADAERGGAPCSGVDGLALTVKGNIPRRGLAWTEGSRLFAGRHAAASAIAVERLEAAGALTIGSTTMTELAMYAPDNPFEPIAVNPWAARRTAGGSSSGAGVAAALRLGHVHLGTDSGGSIRNPALHCGVVGFKPSFGRWPLDGVPCYAPSLDTLGLAACSLADAIEVDAILGSPESGPAVSDVRCVVPQRLIEAVSDRATLALFERAVTTIATAIPVETIDLDGWEVAERAAGLISQAETARATRTIDRSYLAPMLAERLARGDAIADADVDAARATCAAFAAALSARLGDQLILVTPTWPFRAPIVHQSWTLVQNRRVPVDPSRNVFVRAANAAGAPAVTLPTGWYPGIVPFGIQIIAAPGADSMLLDACRKVEKLIGSFISARRDEKVP